MKYLDSRFRTPKLKTVNDFSPGFDVCINAVLKNLICLSVYLSRKN